MKAIIAGTILLLAGAAAQAADLNLGWRASDGTETVKVSVREEGPVTRIRYIVDRSEAVCSQYRRDLCGMEDKVKQVDITLPSKQCVISAPLADCWGGSWDPGLNVIVTLEDGSLLDVKEVQVTVSLGELKRIHKDANDKVEIYVVNKVDLQIWGNRADGLDPLVQSQRSGLFGQDDFMVVNKSLF